MNTKEYLKLWLEDKDKYRILCIMLLFALIYNQINFNTDIRNFEGNWSMMKCYYHNDSLYMGNNLINTNNNISVLIPQYNDSKVVIK